MPATFSTIISGILMIASLLLSVDSHADVIDLGRLEGRLFITLGDKLNYVEDPNGEYDERSVLSAQWIASHQAVPSFGFTSSTYWFRFKLHNPSTQARDLMLELDYPLMDKIEYFNLIHDKVVDHLVTGDSFPFVSRAIPHRNFLFEVQMAPGETRDVLLRAQSTDTMQFPLRLWDAKDFYQFDRSIQMVLGLYYGAMLMIIITNVYIYFFLKDKIYLLFVCSVIAFVTVQGSLNGTLPENLLPHAPVIAKHIRPFFIYACTFFFCGLSVNFLKLNFFAPRLMKVFSVLAWSAVAGIFLQAFVPFTWSIKVSMLMAFGSGAIAIYSSMLVILRQHRPAYWYLAAWVFFIIGGSATILRAFSLLPVNLFTEAAFPVGSVLVALLLAFGLTERLENDRKEKIQAQKDAFDKEHQLRLQLERENQLEIDKLKLAEANFRLHQLSTIDGLTQLHNRRHFNEFFQTEFKRAHRDNAPLGILLMDIDRFKQLNDTYGHPFGDECLKFAALLIRSCIRRPQDLVARYGGEEFVVVLPNTDTTGALHVATLIHQCFNSNVVQDGELETRITVSIGLASIVPGSQDSTERLLKSADLLLYQAKKNGRNRIEHQLQADNQTHCQGQ